MESSMDGQSRAPEPTPAWHALFAPLPADAVPRRGPVGPPEVLAKPEGAAIAGWEQLVIELSAGPAGLRIAMVVLDGAGQPISASDMVLYRTPITGAIGADSSGQDIEYIQESVGGRLEPDGTFRGTRWRTVGRAPADAEDPQLEATPSEPSAGDVAGIKALVADILSRQLPPAGPG